MPKQDGYKTDAVTVCVDFDGPIHTYHRGWHDGSIYGEVVPGAREALQRLRDLGLRVVIYTARVRPGTENDGASAVETWLSQHVVPYDELWRGAGKPLAAAYIDDRGIRWRDWDSALATLGAVLLARPLRTTRTPNGTR